MEIIKKRTSEFKIPIGYNFKDEKRDLIIIDKKRKGSHKLYKYKCNKCGWDCTGEHYRNDSKLEEMWVEEHALISKQRGCSCCCASPQITVPHINSIVAKEETYWMIKYFINEEDARKYTPSSGKSIFMKCPFCGQITNTKRNIDNLHNQRAIECSCGDGFSYSEKYAYAILSQLNVDFVAQLGKNTYQWCDKYKYDFYIPSLDMIIETHGIQHYLKSFNKTDIVITKENDKYKKELALKNGIKHYIELDCRKSEMEWIKNSIQNSKLSDLFDLSKVDWLKCEEFALGNLVKEVCDYWNNKEEWETTKDLEVKFNLKRCAVINYLKRGNILGWCKYDAREQLRLSGGSVGKKIEIFKDYVSLGIFKNATELSNQSENIFGVKLNGTNISAVANGKRNHHKGYTFKYVENEEIA